MQKSRFVNGFTIVELLIVVVVIAILAAISVVAYTGIQERSSNTARIASIRQYITLLSLYATQNGTYPSFTEGACLGAGYTNSECSNSTLSGSWPATATEQIAFNTQLSSVGNLPDYKKLNDTATGSGNEAGAFMYQRIGTNETPSRLYRIVYYLQGSNKDCGIERVLRAVDGTSPIGTGAATVGLSTGPKNSNSNTGKTWCIISLLNPDEF